MCFEAAQCGGESQVELMVSEALGQSRRAVAPRAPRRASFSRWVKAKVDLIDSKTGVGLGRGRPAGCRARGSWCTTSPYAVRTVSIVQTVMAIFCVALMRGVTTCREPPC